MHMHLQLSLPGPTVNIGLSSSMQIGPGMKREGLGVASNRKVKEEREVVSTTVSAPGRGETRRGKSRF